MREMSVKEISEVLAEFEFDQKVEISGNHIYKYRYTAEDFHHDKHELGSRYYTDDLNTLIPIWAKLKDFGVVLRFDDGEYAVGHSYFLIDSVGDEYGRAFPKVGSLQHRLAEATALAILELKNEK